MNAIPEFLITILLFSARSYSQQARTTFILQGTTIPKDTGRMLLMPVNTEDYYPFHGTLEAPVHDGRFSFTDSIAYPTAYMLGLKQGSLWKYLSKPFYVEPGVQELACNIDNMWETPAITNRSMHELQSDFAASFNVVRTEYNRYSKAKDSLNQVYKGQIPDSLSRILSSIEKNITQKSHTALLHYAKNNPGSYVAFWRLVSEFTSGYAPYYDSLYNAFSDNIRQTYTGRVLKKKLDMAKASCIGCRFPDVKFASIENLSRKVTLSSRFSKYTLIDIWFSNCGPCIYQFSKYKELYIRFKAGGFQVIAVSTDTKDKVAQWKKVISENKLPWPQYLDEDGIVEKDFSIISWPSNFLLNEKGIIIQKNISPTALEAFLTANIHSR